MGYCLDLPHWPEIVGQWLYEWQTLIAGLIAIIAAMIGAKAIYQQTQNAQNIARDEIDRRHSAARCVLPLVLSEVSALCQAMADKIAEEIEARSRPDFDPVFDGIFPDARADTLPAMSLPSEIVPAFQDFVETLSDKADIRHVGQMFTQIQILMAQWNSFQLNQIAPDVRLMEILVLVAKVGLLNDGIFNYARMTVDDRFSLVGPVSNAEIWDKIRGKAQGLLFYRPSPDLFFDALNQLINWREDKDVSPWMEKFEW